MRATLSKTQKKTGGFTLIELMIVVAVIGILASIAFPAYQSQVRKSNRAAAQAVMMDAANKQQFFLSSQRRYADTLAELSLTPPADVSRWYDFAFRTNNAATPPTFILVGTAKDAQVKDGDLTLDGTGTKTRDGDPAKW